MKKPTAFGKYYLLERISIGGMAEVFRAKAFGVEGFERLVAVKRILPHVAEDKEFIRMFIEEAKLSVQLNHANIAQIFDLGVVDGSYYIALEHVHGRDLRVLFDRCHQLGEAMPVAQACFIAMKVCEGLDYAHNKRDQAGRELSLVHRDVSPQNILVSFEGEVKLIDFGIAKAAGTGGSTQAGILKGKFGYMSPEQVRGDDVDRKSDVFSCGIVLYELLTGERLFVGESDFSTLEKVRNVEILPPSTYNRKIPDELERIVLKALSKDPEDRYQHAIDLHDELQAFVYTAGEFYSRKDLAAWMKTTFGKEIEDETAKLEGYRQLKPPPPMMAPAPAPTADDAPEPARASGSQGSQASQLPGPSGPSGAGGASGAPGRSPRKPTRPVPVTRSPAVARSQPVPVVPSPPVSRSQPVPVVPSPPVSRSQPVPVVQPPPPVQIAAVPRAGKPSRSLKPIDSAWDDDNIETRVYDGDDPRHRSNRTSLPLQPPVSSSPGIPLPPGDLGPGFDGIGSFPDDGRPIGGRSPDAFDQALQPISGPGAYHNGAPASPTGFAAGSDPLPPAPSDPLAQDLGAMAGRRELSAPYRVTAAPAADVPTIPVTPFGSRIVGNRRVRDGSSSHHLLPIAIGGVALVLIVAIVVVAMSGRSRPSAPPAPAPVAVSQPPPPPPPSAADPSTGFDLYVTPSGITQWKLDGESRTDRLPSRIRGISPGAHTVQIDPPPGFLSQLQQVTVESGKAPKVEIVLQPIPGISGVFDSNPPGATVSLIVDGKRQPVGPSPARASLDPRSAYQVLFEKPGYVSVNRPIAFSGALEEHVVVHLEKVAAPNPPPAPEPRPRKITRPAPERAAPDRPAPATPESRESRESSHVTEPSGSGPDGAPAEPRAGADSRSRAQGVLVLGSKPPCDIAIDGSATGLHTPQKEIKLPVGRHRVTLTNSEFGISETFSVDIKADAPEKLIKDYSDRLPN